VMKYLSTIIANIRITAQLPHMCTHNAPLIFPSTPSSFQAATALAVPPVANIPRRPFFKIYSSRISLSISFWGGNVDDVIDSGDHSVLCVGGPKRVMEYNQRPMEEVVSRNPDWRMCAFMMLQYTNSQ
jgi:hypothetical protein